MTRFQGSERFVATGGLHVAQTAVREFHSAFGHPVADAPRLLDQGRVQTRAAWMAEEVEEFRAACDIASQADAIVDLIYFALGTLVELGVDGGPVFETVHQANISKLGADGRPLFRADGKVAKPPGWRDPTELLRRQLVMNHSRYELVIADDLGCVAASLAMVAHALGLSEYTKDSFASLLPDPVQIPEGPIADYAGFGVLLTDGSLDPYLERGAVPIRDDFAGIEFINEMVFVSEIQRALKEYPSVGIGFDASYVYPSAPNIGHFALISSATDSAISLVDPGPSSAGLTSIYPDHLYLACRAKKDGLHRFRLHSTRTPLETETSA